MKPPSKSNSADDTEPISTTSTIAKDESSTASPLSTITADESSTASTISTITADESSTASTISTITVEESSTASSISTITAEESSFASISNISRFYEESTASTISSLSKNNEESTASISSLSKNNEESTVSSISSLSKNNEESTASISSLSKNNEESTVSSISSLSKNNEESTVSSISSLSKNNEESTVSSISSLSKNNKESTASSISSKKNEKSTASTISTITKDEPSTSSAKSSITKKELSTALLQIDQPDEEKSYYLTHEEYSKTWPNLPLVRRGKVLAFDTTSIRMNHPLREPLCDTNPLVYMDISIGLELAGRIVIELRKDVVPKTAENFRALCTGEQGIGTLGRPLHYKGCIFYKVRRVYTAQSGDVVHNDGTAGESIYGPLFDDESLELEHEEGVVTMVNYGVPNSNNSQFAITAAPCNNLDGTNVVVGRVLRGLSVVGDMGNVIDDEGITTEKITITDCGELPAGEDWAINDDDETGDKLPPYPQDWPNKFDNFKLDESLEMLVKLRKGGNHFFMMSRFYDARRKYRKAHRYYLLIRKRFDEQKPHSKKIDKEVKEKFNNIFEKFDSFAVINNVNMASVELKLDNYASAKKYSTEAIKTDTKYPKAYFRRGQAQIGLKNYDEAIKDLKQALVLLPESKQIMNELRRAQRLSQDYDRGQAALLRNLFR